MLFQSCDVAIYISTCDLCELEILVDTAHSSYIYL